MLVLSRKVAESVIATMPDGRQIQVIVIKFQGDKVKLGFCGPDDVEFNRSEVQEDIDKQTIDPRGRG